MKKFIFVSTLFLAALTLSVCSSSAKCDPLCAEGQLCISHDNQYKCLFKCEKDEDCAKDKTGKDGFICHKDHATPHCDEKE